MNPVQLILLGLVAGVAAGLAILAGSALFVPFSRAVRTGLAGMIGATIAFTLTALVEGPFYPHAQTLAELAEPFGIASIVGAGAAALCALMILRANR